LLHNLIKLQHKKDRTTSSNLHSTVMTQSKTFKQNEMLSQAILP